MKQNTDTTLKFSIITPVYNSAAFLAETIESVIFQKGNFSIEYFIIDNCSTDASVEIAYKYQSLLQQNPSLLKCKDVQISIISEPDHGMYDALNKGFSKATGDVFAYINSDDIYLCGAFEIIADTFQKYPHTSWLKGITSYINEESIIYQIGHCNLYYTPWIKKGIYGTYSYFIQQDSVFWRSDLWHHINKIDPTLKLAGDFYLWLHFAKYADLYSINVPVSCFRKTQNQLSQDITKYYKEVHSIPYEQPSKVLKLKIVLLNYLSSKTKIYFLKNLLYTLLFPTHDYRYIVYDGNQSKLVFQKTNLLKDPY